MKRILFIPLIFILLAFSCKEKAEIDEPCEIIPDTTTSISYHGGVSSHKQGDNCMVCHSSGGNGPAWFNTAGTVYDSTMMTPFPNATIELYNGKLGAGILIATIEVDSFGNFYTTENIDYSFGLNVQVVGDSITAGMGSHITSGACNKCHGVTTNRIWVK